MSGNLFTATQTQPVFRFAPSPNGLLHLGHAYSALVNFELAKTNGGRFLLRIEDIDLVRCTPAHEEQMLEDLTWLGIEWDEVPRRQSEHFADYVDALSTLRDAGLVYPATLSRGALKRLIEEEEAQGQTWPCDPDGAPLYPTAERGRSLNAQEAIIASEEPFAWRLNVEAAMNHWGGQPNWQELEMDGHQSSIQEIRALPDQWGDVVIARRDIPTSYHLSVVVDDALQGITHVVRGKDLRDATSVHRLLQYLLGLPAPTYHHHDLIMADDGRKLSKSNQDTSLKSLREAGLGSDDIKRMVGLA